MKLIIAGGRDYSLTLEDVQKLWQIHDRHGITEVVSGGATGADRCGETWAKNHGIPVKVFPADWNRFGKFAGPARNAEMARYADAVVLFPGGRGTASMRLQAEINRLRIFDFTDAR